MEFILISILIEVQYLYFFLEFTLYILFILSNKGEYILVVKRSMLASLTTYIMHGSSGAENTPLPPPPPSLLGNNSSLCRHWDKVLETNCFAADADAIELHISIVVLLLLLLLFFCPIFCQFRSICCMPLWQVAKLLLLQALQSEILAKCSLGL